MNKTNINYVQYSWNPLFGCENRCWYCYGPRLSKRWGRDFWTPTFYPERLKQPMKVKEPSRVFVCSMADLFGDWVPKEQIEMVLDAISMAPQHTYLFLTKNPRRYLEFEFPKNCWLGTTVTGADRQDRDRLAAMTALDPQRISVKFISAEPLLGNVKRLLYPGYWAQDDLKPDWIIVGALTYARANEAGKFQAKYLKEIMDYAKEKEIPLFVKRNMALREPVQEYPKAVIEPMEYGTDIRTGEVGEC